MAMIYAWTNFGFGPLIAFLTSKMLEFPMFSKWVTTAKAKNGGSTTRLKKTREMIWMNPNFIAFFLYSCWTNFGFISVAAAVRKVSHSFANQDQVNIIRYCVKDMISKILLKSKYMKFNYMIQKKISSIKKL